MSIITSLLDKILFILFFMAIFITGRHTFLFIRHVNKPDIEKYTIARKELIYLGVALAIIMTTLFKGIGI